MHDERACMQNSPKDKTGTEQIKTQWPPEHAGMHQDDQRPTKKDTNPTYTDTEIVHAYTTTERNGPYTEDKAMEQLVQNH